MMMGDPEMDEADEGEFESDGGDIGESWGLTDGESMSSSEAGDISLADSAAAAASANGAWPLRGSAYRMVQLTVVALLLFSVGSRD